MLGILDRLTNDSKLYTPSQLSFRFQLCEVIQITVTHTHTHVVAAKRKMYIQTSEDSDQPAQTYLVINQPLCVVDSILVIKS